MQFVSTSYGSEYNLFVTTDGDALADNKGSDSNENIQAGTANKNIFYTQHPMDSAFASVDHLLNIDELLK